ncbi:unnamed protein product [Mesocestoides corti]|uniref:Uncharacterized protein n=1 Tax=Mesocestoides corti TaxID=53468 RepID=A0A0R3UPA6_MESCO|nr:unnamed protein product [Mesocestoides corti]
MSVIVSLHPKFGNNAHAVFTVKDDVDGELDGGAAVFDENVLSFANMRFHVASENESQVSPPFKREYIDRTFETQRILIWPPADSPNTKIPSVFYFCELVGNPSYQTKFFDLYNRLFTGNVLHSMQSHPESRQTSSLCPCRARLLSPT